MTAPAAGRTGPPSPVQSHFQDLAHQAHAARIGMWIFLATEILLFGGLFASYFTYRTLFPLAFAQTSRHLDLPFGTLETMVLLTSSLLAVLALHYTRLARPRTAGGLLLCTAALGVVFLALHGFEYRAEFREHLLPGRYFSFAPLAANGVGPMIFMSLYFLMTALHGLHVTVGAGVLIWIATRCFRGEIGPDYESPVENAALYWHLVDIIWIFLYPLLYLVS